jgi:hypothetical protein
MDGVNAELQIALPEATPSTAPTEDVAERKSQAETNFMNALSEMDEVKSEHESDVSPVEETPVALPRFEAFDVMTGEKTSLVSCWKFSDCDVSEACSAIATTTPTKICHAAWELTGKLVIPVEVPIPVPGVPTVAGLDLKNSDFAAGPGTETLAPTAPDDKPWDMRKCMDTLDDTCGEHKFHMVNCPSCVHEHKDTLLELCQRSQGKGAELVRAYCSTKEPTEAPTTMVPTAVPTKGTGFDEVTTNMVIRGTSVATFDQRGFKTILSVMLGETAKRYVPITSIVLQLSDITAVPAPARLRRRLADAPKVLGVHVVMALKVPVADSASVQTELMDKAFVKEFADKLVLNKMIESEHKLEMEPQANVHPWKADMTELEENPEEKYVAPGRASDEVYANRLTHSPSFPPTVAPTRDCLDLVESTCNEHKWHTANCPTCIHDNKDLLLANPECEGAMGQEIVTAFCKTPLSWAPTVAPTWQNLKEPGDHGHTVTLITSAAKSSEDGKDTVTAGTKRRSIEKIGLWVLLAVCGMVALYMTRFFFARCTSGAMVGDPLSQHAFPKSKAPPAMHRALANTPAAGELSTPQDTMKKAPLKQESPSQDEENNVPLYDRVLKAQKEKEKEKGATADVMRILESTRSPLGNHTSNNIMSPPLGTPLSENTFANFPATGNTPASPRFVAASPAVVIHVDPSPVPFKAFVDPPTEAGSAATTNLPAESTTAAPAPTFAAFDDENTSQNTVATFGENNENASSTENTENVFAAFGENSVNASNTESSENDFAAFGENSVNASNTESSENDFAVFGETTINGNALPQI